jgi:YHS domain-containing protein
MYRLFLVVGLLLLLFFLIKSALRKPSRLDGAAKPPLDGDQMVQDPACGVFVPRKTAVVRQIGKLTHCFCSRECAEKFSRESA